MDEKTEPSDRVLSDLFDPAQALPPAQPEKRAKGRPEGATAKLLASTVKLTLEDFYFLRAVINGLKATEAFKRYLGHLHSDLHGNIEIPHGNALLARARKIIKDIIDQAQELPEGNLNDLTQRLLEPLPLITVSDKEQCNVAMILWHHTKPTGPSRKQKRAPSRPLPSEFRGETLYKSTT